MSARRLLLLTRLALTLAQCPRIFPGPPGPGRTISTMAGGFGLPVGFGGDGGMANWDGALFNTPLGLAMDTAIDMLYIADAKNHRVRTLDMDNFLSGPNPTFVLPLSTFAGSGPPGESGGGSAGDGGPASSASLSMPTAVAVARNGDVLVSDTGNHRLRLIRLGPRKGVGGNVSTLAGIGTPGATGDGGPATLASLSSPRGVAISASRVVYVADWGNHRLRCVDADGLISTLAGDGRAGSEGDGGPASLARLNEPTGVALDSGGNVFVSEVGSSRVRRIDASSGLITSVAGRGPALPFQPRFAGDGGPATLAQLQAPWGLALDGAGALFIADRLNNRLRRVDPLSGVITTVAGREGFPFHCGDGALAVNADVDSPSGLVFRGKTGTLLLSSAGSNMEPGPFTSRHRVRAIVNMESSGTPSFGSSASRSPSSLRTPAVTVTPCVRDPRRPTRCVEPYALSRSSPSSMDLTAVALLSLALAATALLIVRMVRAFRAAPPAGSAQPPEPPRARASHRMAAKEAARHAAAAISAVAPALSKGRGEQQG